jgi:hypothetical protein
MYLVTTRTATDPIAVEYWVDELRAYLRSDIINKMTDEFTGAIVEEMTDLYGKVAQDQHEDYPDFYIEYTWKNKNQLSGISCDVEIALNIWIKCELEVRLDVNGSDVSYVVKLGGVIYQDEEKGDIPLHLNSKTTELLQQLISEDSAEKEYFHQHDSEEVDEANRLSLEDSQPNVNTL